MKNTPRIPTPPNRSIASLPDDPAALKAMVAALMRRVDTLESGKQELELSKLRLEMELLKYKKWMYGPRADRLASLDGVAQMLLSFGEEIDRRPVDPAEPGVADVSDPATGDAGTGPPSRRVRRGTGRRALVNFERLPVTRHEHDLPEEDKPCPCCGKVREKIGEESSWQIEYVPGHFERLEHVRFKYACGHCEQTASPEGPQIVRAEAPNLPIDRGLAGPGLLAFIVTSKYADYTPLYRLEDIFERSGFAIARSTMSLWCRDVAEILTPLYELMVRRVLASRVIGTDDTIMPMQDPGAGKTRRARMWVYVGGVGDQQSPYTVFDFTLGRSRDGPATFLKDFRGTLLADAYGGYDGVVVGNEMIRAGCWAHARRKFVDAEPSHPAIAAETVGIIKTLYAIEEQGKALDAASRGELRRSASAPILAALKDRLFTWRDQLLPKHPMALAIAYALNQWNELTVFAGGSGVGGAPGSSTPEPSSPPGPADPATFGAVPIGRVGDRRGGGREVEGAVPGRFRANAGVSGPLVAPFPVSAPRTGRAALPHPALIQILRPSRSTWPRGSRAA